MDNPIQEEVKDHLWKKLWCGYKKITFRKNNIILVKSLYLPIYFCCFSCKNQCWKAEKWKPMKHRIKAESLKRTAPDCWIKTKPAISLPKERDIGASTSMKANDKNGCYANLRWDNQEAWSLLLTWKCCYIFPKVQLITDFKVRTTHLAKGKNYGETRNLWRHLQFTFFFNAVQQPSNEISRTARLWGQHYADQYTIIDCHWVYVYHNNDRIQNNACSICQNGECILFHLLPASEYFWELEESYRSSEL